MGGAPETDTVMELGCEMWIREDTVEGRDPSRVGQRISDMGVRGPWPTGESRGDGRAHWGFPFLQKMAGTQALV